MANETKYYAAEALRGSKRLVIKVGSALLCTDDGAPNRSWLTSLASDVATLKREGVEVVLVTSGAIALGRGKLHLAPPLRLDEKQAASAAGQILLAEAWQDAFVPHGITIAQVLLTLEDTEDRRRYLNARATLRTLLDLGALPVINENDTVATSEIRYGDNDRLAAHAAQVVDADLLVILSDIDGYYTADPRKDDEAAHIPVVREITSSIIAAAQGANEETGKGSGGMATKVMAAEIAGASGCATIIASGTSSNPISAVLAEARATLFLPSHSKENARRLWIGGRINAAGSITIDNGAANAVREGASLLPVGVVVVEGSFRRGDAVTIVNSNGDVLGQGLSTYDAVDLTRIIGQSSDAIEATLGYRRRPAVIERNDLVLKATAL